MSNETPMKKCGDCRQIGHTSTECNNEKVGCVKLFGVKINPTTACNNRKVGCVKLFGVRINPTATADRTEEDDCCSIYEPKSMQQVLRICNNDHTPVIDLESNLLDEHSHDHKNKGVPWTKDEHRSFLRGLEQVGKGHWRVISNKYVLSRTPTQVASHAQKFFIRKNSTEDKRKRRSSVFDMPLLDEYIGYEQRNDHIPCVREQHVQGMPFSITKRVATLVSQPLPITTTETYVEHTTA